jgi:hypothetical protein
MRISSPLSSPAMSASYLTEPLLRFAHEGLHENPKSGIARYGPLSYSSARMSVHPDQVRVGLIGTAETAEACTRWLQMIGKGVAGDARNPEFPGFEANRGFYSELRFSPNWNELFTQTEVRQVLAVSGQRARFEALEMLIDEKLRLLSDRDSAPQYVIVGLPDEIVQRCRVANYTDKTIGRVHRDLRRAIKSIAMKYRMPTQLLSQGTIDGRDTTPLARIAWNFCTGLYFKAGGTPWGPEGLPAGTCYVGVGFYKPLGDAINTMQASLVQAFDEHGEGLVLRGHDFEWDPAKQGSRSPHLSHNQAGDLIEKVLTRYTAEMKQSPRRVVIHKTSRYWPDERSGFQAALGARVESFDLLALERQSNVRLLTTATYPPLRGTRFSVGDIDFVYTTGFVASLGEYHGVHVPSPIRVADHVHQDTPREDLLREVLTLTKMNWNWAGFGMKMPITLRFSELVGDVLREVPPDREPLPQFKYYV